VGNKPKHILIVGSGLAGSTLAMELIRRGNQVLVVDNNAPNSSSRVAAGIINPIVPKGVKLTWQYQQIFPAVFDYYRQLEIELDSEFIYPYPMLQIHANDNERHEWRKRSEVNEIRDILLSDGENTIVRNCGRLDVLEFLTANQIALERKHQFINEQFKYEDLAFLESGMIGYHGSRFDDVVFCEGIGVMQNPWFNYLFFDPTGGDILTVHIPGLSNNKIIKQKQWIVPTKEKEVFLLGSTFHKQSMSEVPNPEDAHSLLERARMITGKEVTLIRHQRAIRPTVQSRRPYLGRHQDVKNLCVYNGLGSKGSALCSWLSPMMADYITYNTQLNEEVDIAKKFWA
jgi:glycine/D-amino acid oxidase-like deaminating enzyme